MTSQLRMLHLEDDPVDAKFIKATLKDEGITCDILRVETRDDFIEAISKHHFDIFFCRLPITMLRRSFCACHRKGKVPEHNVHLHLMVIWNRRPSK